MFLFRLEDEEIKKIVEQRKREKEEEKRARDRVKAQIEADKAARRAKFGGEVNAIVKPAEVQPSQPAQSNVVPTQPKDYTQTRIQVGITFYNLPQL